MTFFDERGLARRAKQGDKEAFGEIVRRHQTAVFNVAYRMLGNHHEAEDIAQESFIRAYRAFSSFDSERPLLPWLRRIATNLSLNQIKKGRPLLPLNEGLPHPEPPPGPEMQAAGYEEGRSIREAILSLPPRYRAVIELRHFQDLSYAEIAQALGRPLSDVKSDLFRARRKLAQQLKALKHKSKTQEINIDKL